MLKRDNAQPSRKSATICSLRSIPPARLWVYRFVASVLLPALALASVELILVIAGVGHPTSFFLRTKIGGTNFLVENSWFGQRFFPPALARSPAPVVMKEKKVPGTYRIFLFGESAALGDPKPAYGMGRCLESLLRQRFPATKFEVICTAMTAINSHAIVPLARECARYEGDLWIIYTGNNELMGPFGANGVFGSQTPPTQLVRFYLALAQTRTGQLLMQLTRSLGNGPQDRWGGMKMFVEQQLAPADPRRQRVDSNFRKNLADILEAGRRAGVPVILCSVASNQKDCAPFRSVHDPPLESDKVVQWESVVAAGGTNVVQREYSNAIERFESAVQMSPAFAEVYFRLAEAHLRMGNVKAARQNYVRARDLDALPFRALTGINRAIAETASQQPGQNLVCIDAEQALAPMSQSGIPGEEAFYEHVHLTFEGNYRLARAMADEAVKFLPKDRRSSQKSEWPPLTECADELGFTDWNRYAALREIARRLSEAPFSLQFNHASRVRGLAAQMQAVRQRLTPSQKELARRVYETALHKRPGDYWLRQSYAEFLAAIEELGGAVQEMNKVIELIPHHYAAYVQIARLLARQREYSKAIEYLTAALRIHPDLPEIRLELAQVYAAADKPDSALEQCAAALKQGLNIGRLHLLKAHILEQQKKRAEAIRSVREAIQIQPENAEAHEVLGMQLTLEGDIVEAGKAFSEVVRLRPSDPEAHLNLAISLARQQRFPEAVEHLRKTLELQPENQKARELLNSLQQDPSH